MTKGVDYVKGLHQIGNDSYAYLQPAGQWGYSNAGLVTSPQESLLVDTLFSLDLTREMLATIQREIPGHSKISWLVNTHANGDHCYGNQLVPGATIVSSRAVADDVAHDDPTLLSGTLASADKLGELGAYFSECFGDFDFSGIEVTAPTTTFNGELILDAAGREIHLIELGPAHTTGDIVVHVPDEGVLFAGDLLFIGGTPIVWAGPLSNWMRACDAMEELNPSVVVPGHGPVCGVEGIRQVRGYLEFVLSESKQRLERGMDPWSATLDIDVGAYSSWLDNERLALNVAMAYVELDGSNWSKPSVIEAFDLMSRYRAANR